MTLAECWECAAPVLQGTSSTADQGGGGPGLVVGALSFAWTYWIVASVVLGEAVVSFFMGYALGSGWRGVAFYFCSALVVLAYGGSVLAWVLVHVPEPFLRAGCVCLVLSLAGAVLWFQPGEVSDGREGLPKNVPTGGPR